LKIAVVGAIDAQPFAAYLDAALFPPAGAGLPAPIEQIEMRPCRRIVVDFDVRKPYPLRRPGLRAGPGYITAMWSTTFWARRLHLAPVPGSARKRG